MNVLYVAPRFHTNQVPIIKGWLKNGDRVMFLCQYSMPNEDYTVLQPTILGYSRVFKLILKAYQAIFERKITKAQVPMYFNAQYGFPPMKKVKKIISEFHPDIIIYRDRSIYNTMIYRYCRKKGIKGILYNQTPFREKDNEKTDIFHRIIRGLNPQIRMTPVLGMENTDTEAPKTVYYVPFVIEPKLKAIEEKQYFRDGKINIVCVGKFEERKHHIELLETISKLKCRDEIDISFIGECSRPLHEMYLERLKSCVQRCDMERQTRILSNLSLDEVYEEYLKADLFVLPSTGEFASISQLEAMSCALPVICSDTNGTADCVRKWRNGFLFRDKDFNDLRNVMEDILQDRQRLIAMGKESYRIVIEEYDFERYRGSILKMMEEAEKR